MFKSALLKEVFFDSLCNEERALVNEKMTSTVYAKDQVIFYEGAMPFGIFVLKKGKVKLYKNGENGKKQIFQLCTSGDMFGGHAVINDYPYPDSAATLEECEIQFIPKHLFVNLVKTNSKLSFNLLIALGEEFKKFIEQETMLFQKPVRERVALVLFVLSELYKTEDDSNVVSLSRSDLSDLCGTVKETLVRTLSEFKKDKLIQSVSTKDLEILDATKLRKIANY